MEYQRVSPTEFLVFGPLEAARVATWNALVNIGMRDVVIDLEKNLVAGTKGDGVLSSARVATATFTPSAQSVSVSITSRPVLSGTIDFGAGKRETKKIGDVLEQMLARQGEQIEPAPTVIPPHNAPPIPLPTGASTPVGAAPMHGPIYGSILAPKRGTTLLVYGVLGMLCCQILAPFTVAYSIGALKEYRSKGDPGDRGLVIASLVMGILGCFFIVGRIALMAQG